ncbi:MAG: recombinase family protein [Lachnospiraceae bacterium]|jgi:DNA invertase Pin-like site-specific DNA recombinase|nr:recombinase family protein [Lachnospiraceae bacterium]
MKEVAGIYCRLSEEDRFKKCREDDSESIQNQKSMLITYAVEQGWEIYSIYSDDDYTGADRNRPEFNRMLRDAEDGKINIVLCKSQSRFSRELEIVEKYIHGYFLLWNVRFVGVVDNADTALRGNKKARQINGLVNEWYLEDMSESVKSVLNDKRSKGLHIGSSAAYGYKKDPEKKGHLVIDAEAAAVVHEIFERYAAGYGKTEIAKELNHREVPSPFLYKCLTGEYIGKGNGSNGKFAHLWRYHSVNNILHNQMYIGNMVQGKSATVSYKIKKKYYRSKEQWYIVEHTHEPIIERELWDKVQSLLGKAAKPQRSGKVSILSGKVVCAGCGYALKVSHTRGKRYLRCKVNERLEDICQGCCISEDFLKQKILEAYKEMIRQYLNEEQAESLVTVPGSDNRREQKKAVQKEVTKHRQEQKQCEAALKELYMDRVKGNITIEEYRTFSESFSKDIDRYEMLIADGQRRLEEIGRQEKETLSKKEIIKKYADIHELNYDIMNIFVDRIEVGRRNGRQEEYPVKIYWKF